MNFLRYLLINLRRYASDPDTRRASSHHMLAGALAIYARETSPHEAAKLCLEHLSILERQQRREREAG